MINSPKPIIFFRVGYMSSYDGVGQISGGGSHIDEQGFGGEMWNFQSQLGKCLGYVMSTKFSGIDLKKIAPSRKWKTGDALDGVDVVYFAPRPGAGAVIVGWYKDARIYHRKYRDSTNPFSKGQRWAESNYLCETSSDNAYLLAEMDRNFEIRSGQKQKGFPGQSNVWYADSELGYVGEFVQSVRKYIYSSPIPPVVLPDESGHSFGWKSTPNVELITKVEAIAVNLAKKHFEAIGYNVDSVETDCRGWDLEATRADEKIYLEVKGHVGDVIKFELTPNEYAQLRAKGSAYRVCVVLRALDSPTLSILRPKKSKDGWSLVGEAGLLVKLQESVAARAIEIA